MNVLIINSDDSFVYNVYQFVGTVTPNVRVVYNDEISLAQIEAMRLTHIIFSPGPGRPKDAGIYEDAVRHFAGKIPMLGICLGHQAVCEAFGAEIVGAPKPMVGKRGLTASVHIANGNPIFRGLPPMLTVGQYHSLVANRDTLPEELLVIAETDDGEVMGVKHRQFDVFGLQFHPESILTVGGQRMIENFLRIGGNEHDQ